MTERDKYHEPIEEGVGPAAAAEQPSQPQEAPPIKKEAPIQPEKKVEEVSKPEVLQSAKEITPTASAPVADSSPATPAKPTQPAEEPADKKRVEQLTQIAFDKGLTEAIEEAKKANNPYILDEFHDALTNDLYEKLVEAKKLEQK